MSGYVNFETSVLTGGILMTRIQLKRTRLSEKKNKPHYTAGVSKDGCKWNPQMCNMRLKHFLFCSFDCFPG